MKTGKIIILASLMSCLLTLGVSSETSLTGARGQSAGAKEEFVLTEINRIRGKRGLSALRLNSTLQDIARRHSTDMATSGYFSHTDPLGHGLKYRLSQANLSSFLAAENIQKNDFPDSAQAAVEGWLQSPGHLQNIVNAKFSETGEIGRAHV